MALKISHRRWGKTRPNVCVCVLSDPNRCDFESQIASDCNRNSKKITATPKTPLTLRFRFRTCDWQSLAICDCDGVSHKVCVCVCHGCSGLNHDRGQRSAILGGHTNGPPNVLRIILLLQPLSVNWSGAVTSLQEKRGQRLRLA